jgi:hypothetical protein
LPLADLPLRDDARRPDPTPQRELTFGQPPESAASRGGVLVWFVAAAALVVGIVLGFSSGYAAGQRNAAGSAPQAEPDAVPTAAPPATYGPTPEASSFSEVTVPEPTRVDPVPVVIPEEPEDRPAVPRRSSAPKSPNVATVSSGPGSIEVVSRPAGAQVIVDGRIVGRTPLSIPNIAAGTHTIRLELAGFNRWATSVEVAAGARAQVRASLEQP